MQSPAILLCLAISLAAASAAQAADEPPDAREAIRRGLAFVETKSMAWLHERKCASCHHVPMMVWAQRAARERGFAIDEAALQEATDFLLAEDNRAGVLPNPGEPDRPGNPYSLLAVFTTLAFREGGDAPPPAAEAIAARTAEHVLARQEADGSWKRFEGRPPVMDIQEAATLLAEHSLRPAPADDATAANRAKTREWLAANSRGENQQALSLRILIDYERQASVELLLARQRPDGGWGQNEAMVSDAHATGQAIYALASRGGLDAQHPAIVAARGFLVTTQQADGSWLMTSRPPNNGGDVDGAGNLEPITVAASAWAVLGLLQATTNAP